MTEPLVLDIDRLTAPLTEAGAESAVGPDLRADGTADAPYQLLKLLHRTARDLEKRAMTGPRDEAAAAMTEAKQKWRDIFSSAKELLETKSKDLEVAAWVIDAAARCEGFMGLRDSLRQFRELCSKYWDDIHPVPDEERGFIGRVSALRGMIGEDREGALIQTIRLLPIIRADERDLSASDFLLAMEYEKLEIESERAARAEADGGVTLATFESLATAADWSQMNETAEAIESALEEVAALESLLDERCPREEHGEPVAPSFANLRNVLREQCLRIVRQYCPKQNEAENAADEGSPNGSAAGPGNGRLAGGGADPAASREDALRLVTQAAEFFRRTEPHSPVSYALHEIVRWGRMPLPKLMEELVDDDGDRKWFFKMVGVKREEA